MLHATIERHFPTNRILLRVAEMRGDRTFCLVTNEEWVEVPEGAAVTGGLLLPPGADQALLAAVDFYHGRPSHPADEVRVLREWLEVERARVDRMLGR